MNVRRLLVLLPGLAILASCQSRVTTVSDQSRLATGSRQAIPIDDSLCREFARLKNAGESKANDLLAPGLDLTQTVIDEQDKAAFDAASVLHEPCRIVRILPRAPTASPPRFALIIEGVFNINVAIRNKTGVQDAHRNLYNPEVLVEVRDGRIHPLKAGLPPP